MYRAARFDKIITITRPVTQTSSFGSQKTTYEVVTKTRANVDLSQGRRSTMGDEVRTAYSITFRVRRYEDVKEGYVIEWGGHKWNVNSVILDERMGVLEIDTDMTNE